MENGNDFFVSLKFHLFSYALKTLTFFLYELKHFFLSTEDE